MSANSALAVGAARATSRRSTFPYNTTSRQMKRSSPSSTKPMSAAAGAVVVHAFQARSARRAGSRVPAYPTGVPVPSRSRIGSEMSEATLARSSSTGASAIDRSRRSFCMATVLRSRCRSPDARAW